ncbi:hypothetical protein HHI36_003039 [Cryptolaemus montrouzieri]|uniref:START domain-containing protein n=1 Tax=Cryptolaemus montrouzieri TaxID=559131 RepID=A0ABD2PC99_9CUCU
MLLRKVVSYIKRVSFFIAKFFIKSTLWPIKAIFSFLSSDKLDDSNSDVENDAFEVVAQKQNPEKPTIDERSPLIRHYLRGATPSVYTESVENYQSPMQSPEGSLYRSENNSGAGRYPPADLSREEMDKYEALCCKIMEESKELLRCDKWTLERTLNQDESAHSMVLPSGHRIFKIYAIFNTSPKNMLHVLYDDIEVLSKWNSALVEAHRVQEIDEDADIIYQVSASGAGGLVSSRDFVSIRKWTQIGDSYLIATRGTDHPNVPKNSKYVRGENGVTCLYIEPWNDDKCRLEFILNTHLRGWIPQAIVDLAIVDTLVDYTKSLKVHIDKKYPQNNDDIQ